MDRAELFKKAIEKRRKELELLYQIEQKIKERKPVNERERQIYIDWLEEQLIEGGSKEHDERFEE